VPVERGEPLPASAPPPAPEVYTAAGARDEVWLSAKRIRTLLDAGCPPEEIAVVARTLDPYLVPLAAFFDEHRIPYDAPPAQALLDHPLAQAVLGLFRAALDDLPRDLTLDVVRHPLFRGPADRRLRRGLRARVPTPVDRRAGGPRGGGSRRDGGARAALPACVPARPQRPRLPAFHRRGTVHQRRRPARGFPRPRPSPRGPPRRLRRGAAPLSPAPHRPVRGARLPLSARRCRRPPAGPVAFSAPVPAPRPRADRRDSALGTRETR